MELQFGKNVKVGNFVVQKFTKSLSKKELKAMRSAAGIPADVQEHLQRAKLPYIKVSTVSGSWSVEWVIGSMMYRAIEAVPVARDAEGNLLYYGNGYKNLYAIFNAMFTDTCTVGDFEYQKAKQELMEAYLERATAAAKDEPTAEDEAESEKDADEALRIEQNRAMIIEMGKEVKNGGRD